MPCIQRAVTRPQRVRNGRRPIVAAAEGNQRIQRRADTRAERRKRMGERRRRAVLRVAAVGATLAVGGVLTGATAVAARDVEDILREKGYITEEEYREIKRGESAEAKPKAAAKDEPASFKFGYKPGKGFSITSADGNHALTIGGRIQVRYTGTDRNDGGDQSSFRIRRARVWLEGHLYSPKFRYGIQGDFADDFELRDAYVEFAHVEPAVLKVGQFKIPFNRQQITSSGALQFVDRSIINDEFILGDDGRDIGGMVYGEIVPELLAYNAGLFNGSGPNTTNEDTDLLTVGRVLLTPLGPFKDYYVEGDHVGDDTPRLGIGAAVAYSGDESDGRTVDRTGLIEEPGFTGADVLAATADAHFKVLGFSMLADYHYRKVDPRGSTLARFDGQGVQGQAGYFVLPKKLEVAARYAWLDPDDETRNDDRQEYGGAVGYFFASHNLKVQADLRNVDTERSGKDRRELEGRVQVQAIF
jgi:phosphate-selective porin OprO and OprP